MVILPAGVKKVHIYLLILVIFGLHNLEKPKGARIASLTQNYVTVHPNFHKDRLESDILLILLDL